ncbi:MAG: nicotinate (nicotinamide) nucleotide adenylyltransferase [Opitutaceae bacterium]|nr:nicotinate (nicotinamide) nucleotide adenylyltransferase [Opitutaceae bacterium]|tara:strand:+ start:782 stop:1384 length:603 start_codon:yes stop_codon:yes gene_type:complete
MKTDLQSVAILGGAFDPIHLGHLSLAEAAYAKLDLDEIWFMATAQSPLKPHKSRLPATHRVELLEAALESYPNFKVDRSEIERGGVNFTHVTICNLNFKYPDTRFYWIIGGDQLAQLDKWRNIDSLVALVEFLVVERPGYLAHSQTAPEIPGLKFQNLASRRLDISSSDIRERIASGKPVNDLLPKSVAELIVRRNFYTD